MSAAVYIGTLPLDRRLADRRVLDCTVDIDPTQEWLAEKDRRHAERRQFAERPEPTGFGALTEPRHMEPEA